MPVEYERAPEVKRLAQKIIDAHHPHLRGIRIEYVYRSKASKRHGKTVLGTARKKAGLDALLATPEAHSSEDLDFFVVTIARDMWDRIDDGRRKALIDHELQHCQVDIDPEEGTAKLSLRGHDIEEFAAIVKRHGLWSSDLEFFVEALPAEQVEMFQEGRADVALTISHTDADGHTSSVDTTTGELSKAAEMLRHGSGLHLVGSETPGQDPSEPDD